MKQDNRTLTILMTARAHIGVGNLEFATQVLTEQIEAIQLEAKAERRRDKEYHIEVRRGHSHSKVDVSQVHYHYAGKPKVRMLPIVAQHMIPLLDEETIRGGNDPWLEEKWGDTEQGVTG